MSNGISNLNRTTKPRTVFANLVYSYEAKGKNGTFPYDCGVYEGPITKLQLLEDTVAAIEAEIERLKAK